MGPPWNNRRSATIYSSFPTFPFRFEPSGGDLHAEFTFPLFLRVRYRKLAPPRIARRVFFLRAPMLQ